MKFPHKILRHKCERLVQIGLPHARVSQSVNQFKLSTSDYRNRIKKHDCLPRSMQKWSRNVQTILSTRVMLTSATTVLSVCQPNNVLTRLTRWNMQMIMTLCQGRQSWLGSLRAGKQSGDEIPEPLKVNQQTGFTWGETFAIKRAIHNRVGNINASQQIHGCYQSLDKHPTGHG